MFALVQPLDNQALYALAAARFEPLTTIMKAVTYFGEWYILLPLSALIIFVLARKGWRIEATELAYSVIGTSIAVVLIKQLAARPRPPVAFRAVAEAGYSFPSWHAAIAVAFWGYLAFLAMRRVRHESGRIALAIASALLAGIIGFSRLYLGVHYFSDVIGGFCLGAIALTLALRATRASRRAAV